MFSACGLCFTSLSERSLSPERSVEGSHALSSAVGPNATDCAAWTISAAGMFSPMFSACGLCFTSLSERSLWLEGSVKASNALGSAVGPNVIGCAIFSMTNGTAEVFPGHTCPSLC